MKIINVFIRFFTNWFEETESRRKLNKREKSNEKYIKIKEQHIKISKSEEKKVKFIARILETTLILISIGLFSVYIIIFLQSSETTETVNSENINDADISIIKNKAKIELISNSLKKIDIYILMNNESPFVINYNLIKSKSQWGNNDFLPFFYQKEVAEDFRKNYLKIKNNSKLKVQKADLGFIYHEYRTSPFARDYLLFLRKNGKWMGLNFNKIVVYYPKNIDDNVPFFLYKDNSLVAIPYFLNQADAKELTAKLGKKWKISQNYLIKVVEQIPESDIGQAITIMPINF